MPAQMFFLHRCWGGILAMVMVILCGRYTSSPNTGTCRVLRSFHLYLLLLLQWGVGVCQRDLIHARRIWVMAAMFIMRKCVNLECNVMQYKVRDNGLHTFTISRYLYIIQDKEHEIYNGQTSMHYTLEFRLDGTKINGENNI